MVGNFCPPKIYDKSSRSGTPPRLGYELSSGKTQGRLVEGGAGMNFFTKPRTTKEILVCGLVVLVGTFVVYVVGMMVYAVISIVYSDGLILITDSGKPLNANEVAAICRGIEVGTPEDQVTARIGVPPDDRASWQDQNSGTSGFVHTYRRGILLNSLYFDYQGKFVSHRETKP